MLAWMSASLAVLVTVSKLNSLTTLVPTAGSTGATLTSFTTTTKLLLASSTGLTASYGSLLLTTVVTTLVPGLWLCAGVQVIMPLVLMLIPAGALISP